jgi:hypothetical protein
VGLGGVAWDRRPEQSEALLNSHSVRDNGILVHDIAECHGGRQCIEGEGVKIHLDFDSSRILSIPIRMPTDEELNSLPILWLTPRIPLAGTQFLLHSRRNKAEEVREDAVSWEKCLGYCPEGLLAKTLKATTQLCSHPVEMENRDSPRQYQKKLLVPLHP